VSGSPDSFGVKPKPPSETRDLENKRKATLPPDGGRKILILQLDLPVEISGDGIVAVQQKAEIKEVIDAARK
tara:strand:+ start:227 stop:442 length:216 start_codon:yes stop_codon:yes gene_type:complete